MENQELRLQRYIARCGVCSRRAAALLIDARRVKVNGLITQEPWYKVSSEDTVSVDNHTVSLIANKVYLALHKPACYLSSLVDPQGRALVKDLIPPALRTGLFHVGRLDYLSSGLLLLTNDGDFAQRVSHPSFEFEKEYFVETYQRVSEKILQQWLNGIEIDDALYHLLGYKLLNATQLCLLLHEGKNREIRRVFKEYKIGIKQIHRYRIGAVHLGNLAEGAFRKLEEFELKDFFHR